MDWGYKAVLTAMVVAAVMMAARLLGRPAAGLLAGLPVITAPALMWLAEDQGAAFAAQSAVGSLAACAAAAAFVWAFERAARRHHAAVALIAASVAFAATAFGAKGLDGHPLVALLAAALMCTLAHRAVTAHVVEGGWVRPLRGEPWLSATLAGVISAGVSVLAQRVGPFWSGLLSTMPLIGACALVHLRLAGGPGDVTRFVTGYLPGLFAKAMFLFCFALLAPQWSTPAAFALALTAGACSALVLARLRQSGPRARGANVAARPARMSGGGPEQA